MSTGKIYGFVIPNGILGQAWGSDDQFTLIKYNQIKIRRSKKSYKGKQPNIIDPAGQ